MSTSGTHLLQIYDDPSRLVDRAGDWLAEGASLGESLIVIATPAHADALRRRLAERSVDVHAVDWLDAEETLARFMVDGRPDSARFDAVVGRLVRETTARAAGTRAYGEMVDVLWQEGRAQAAIELETLWNELLRQENFSLYCAYAVDLFAPKPSSPDLLPVLARHTHLVEAGADLQRAVDAAMRETLGAEAVDALLPLIRATRHTRELPPGPEATLLWIRGHLPHLADAVLSRSRAHYHAAR